MVHNRYSGYIMKKLIGFDDDLMKKVQAYADKYFGGNFNMAVRYFCVVGTDDES